MKTTQNVISEHLYPNLISWDTTLPKHESEFDEFKIKFSLMSLNAIEFTSTLRFNIHTSAIVSTKEAPVCNCQHSN